MDMVVLVFLALILACALFLAGLIVLFGSFKRKENHFRLKNKLVIPILLLYASIAIFRFLLIALDDGFGGGLSKTILEMGVYACIHAFQTFSLDEEYHVVYRAFTESILPSVSFLPGFISKSILFIFILENVLAPVMGGAFILDILSDIFPKIRLRVSMFFRKKRVYIFSCISDKTVTLAESIRKHYPGAVIVFTDVYLSRGDELQAERLERARLINAICLKEDMSLVDIIGRQTTVYYLMDDEETNMHTLAELTTAPHFRENWKKGKEVELRVSFDSRDMDALIEHSNKELMEAGLENVLVIPIGESENTIYDLLQAYPLYSVISPSDRKLNILIVGDSKLSRRFFEISYWMGQMLDPREPVSDGLPQLIEAEIIYACNKADKVKRDYEDKCPDIFAEKPGYVHDMTVRFMEYREEVFTDLLESIEDRNYVFVDCGNDYRNIQIAEKIKEYYDRKHVARENRLLINTLLSNQKFMEIESSIFTDQKGYGRINTFGCVSDRYSYEAIMRPREREESYTIDRSHGLRKLREFYTDLYGNRSSVASYTFFDTRLFSAGITGDEKDRAYREILQDFDDYLCDESHVDLKSWEEKNRWNAYTRMTGYRTPKTGQALDFYEKYGHFEMHKENSGAKKLYHMHTCLIDLVHVNTNPIEKLTVKRKEELGGTLREMIKKEYLDQAETGRAALCEEYPVFPLYLHHLLEYLKEDHSDPALASLDELDVLSLLANKDYKSYDYEQIRNLAADKLKKLKDQEL